MRCNGAEPAELTDLTLAHSTVLVACRNTITPIGGNQPMSDDTQDLDLKLVDDALKLLSEHFDNVHIFAARHEGGEDGGTTVYNKGIGNWFARWGQIDYWHRKQSEQARIEQRSDNEDE